MGRKKAQIRGKPGVWGNFSHAERPTDAPGPDPAGSPPKDAGRGVRVGGIKK